MWFNDTTVEGYLLDSATFEPFKDVKVQLFRYHSTGWIFPTNERKLVKTKYTNEDGRFIIKFNQVGERAYYLDIDFDHNFEYFEYMNNEYVDIEEIEIDSINKYKYIYIKKK